MSNKNNLTLCNIYVTYEIVQTTDFKKWYFEQEIKIRAIIDARFSRIKNFRELGDVKYLGNKLFELRWKMGIRVYFIIKDNKTIILLNGGSKNGQKRDIQKARKLHRNCRI